MKNFSEFLIKEKMSIGEGYQIAIGVLEENLISQKFEKLYPEGDDEYNPETHWFGSKNDMDEYIHDILEELDSLPNKITIYRGIVASKLSQRVSEHNLNWESWSEKESEAKRFTNNNNKSWLITGLVDKKDVNWPLTINRRIIFPYEIELAVKNPMEVKIISIKNLETNKTYTKINVDKENNRIKISE